MTDIRGTRHTSDTPGVEPAARYATATTAATGPTSDLERPLLEALRKRRSHSKVTDEAPSREELEQLLSAMNTVADHKSLRPWRIIELRGKARTKLGEALAKATGSDRDKMIAKAKRAPLLLTVVVSPREGEVPLWEQEAVAAGVAHYLGLLLEEAGWGSIWRTGGATRSRPVQKAMRLATNEYMLGWLYVGGIPERDRKPKPRKALDLDRHLTTL